MAKRVWLTATGLLAAVLVFGALTVFVWTTNETHFDRPDERFDQLTTEIEDLPGVTLEEKQRWVEAPTFANPTSWIQLTVEEEDLPRLLDAACATDYPDTVAWSLSVRTDGGNLVSLHSDRMPGGNASDAPCPDFRFDAGGFVGVIDSVVSHLSVQPAIWENGQFAIVAIEDPPEGLAALLPLVAHSGGLRDAAGLDQNQSVEINAANLSAIVEPDEHDRYFTLLSELAEEQGVTSYWADGGGTQIDGVAKVQIVAPDGDQVAITDAIRTSGLHVADFPVRFISD